MKNMFSFYLVISLFLGLINTESIFILETAQEKSSTDNNILLFTIEAGINEDIKEDILFKIDSEFYEDNNYLKDKKVDCIIPKTLDASFGTKIKIKCSIDLYKADCLKANKIKFAKFIKDENVDISDRKQSIIGNDLTFEKRVKEEEKKEKENKKDIKTDYEFTAERVSLSQYIGNKIIFLIEGQFNSLFMPEFEFDLMVNRNIKSQCKSPRLFFQKDGKINCTLIIQTDNEYFLESIKDRIIIEENVYNIKISFFDEKTMKFIIKGKDKLEISDFKSKKGQIIKEEEEERKSEWEIQREIERRKREKEREDEKKKKDQDELEDLLKRRQQIEKGQNDKNNYQNPFYGPGDYGSNRYPNNQNNNNNNYYQNNNYNNNNYFNNQNKEDEQIDYSNKVKLIHLQVRYSYDIIYYMFYALTPIPLDHKIKVGFTITTSNYNYGESNKVNKNIILKTEEEITPNDKSVIVEYIARFECPQCKKIVLDKNNINGAVIYNIPNEEYLLDAININQMGNYLQKSRMQSPPLYISENIFNQNCKLELAGNFFNKNKFFISKFPLKLIGSGYFDQNKNVTIYCGLNEREIFSCQINENLNNFEFRLEQFVIDKKENILIDNTKMTRDRMTFRASCQMYGSNAPGNIGGINTVNQNQNDLAKNVEQMPDILIKKRTNWKKIFLIILSLIVGYYIISKCCCKKEEEENVEYDSRWRVSSSNYGGETYGLRSRGW